MNFKRFFSGIIILFVTLQISSPAFALTSKQKGIILDNFKRSQFNLLFDDDNTLFDGEDQGFFSISNKLNMYQTISNNIKDKREYLEQQNENIAKRIMSLEGTIAELDEDIADTIKQAEQTNDDIVYTSSQIENQKKTIEVLTKKVEENREILLDYLVHIYKKGNYMYEGEDIDNLKTIILSGEDIGDVINDVYFKGVIEITGKKLIDQHRSYISTLYMKKLDLEKQESSLKELRKDLMIQKKMLDEKKELKQRILDVSKGEESLYKKYITEKIELEKTIKMKELQERIKFNDTKKKMLEKYNCDYIDLSKDTIFSRNLSGKCLELNKIIYAESQLKSFKAGMTNVLSWPVNPYYGISAYFHDDGYQKVLGSSHDAIDIVIPQGTPIKAPAEGYVLYINPPDTQDYAFLALKHPDGFVTVYGHVNEVFVKENDFVNAGAIIAKSGGAYGTKGAGIMTTGAHLHFEVFKDKESKDPLEFLDLSYLSYSSLPEKYKFKFTKDYKERKGYEYVNQGSSGKKVFKLVGDTEIDRQKYLLNTYASPAFRDWNIWVEEAIDGGIDPSFVMCIGLAETTLGNYLKTPYNVGNVGNTDSGATKTMTNARQGVYLMVQTLNNKYLGRYTEVQQLSRYGNKKGSIYASSPTNWHNNIVKCLSHLKQEYIPDDYKFRVR
ncbi:peptidoglycan DD-metalloendopeptidase family protein [Candidatus Gracilibacteria bacterium]|nr:peptidoglycan DD-metalloendopeptidase family protein [Candidatus Gracilibacteria bacterium]NUJ99078.1 peptidoglycan DD-metalloendopeptidase family protein [Candidatus Gracilibacteria bacterium]